MFDTNEFKRNVRQWMSANPAGDEAELVDFCEELIPAKSFAANKWLIEQTVYWFRHIRAQSKLSAVDNQDDAL